MQRQNQLKFKLKSAFTGKLGNVASVFGAIIILYFSVQNEIIFRLFVILFLLGSSYYLNKKINAIKLKTDSPIIPKIPVEELDNQQTQIFQKTVSEKEQQLEKIDLDRTQLLEELFTKAELDELEKKAYREKIKQKESERSYILEDLLMVKGKFQHAVLETKKYFVKQDPMKEVAAAIEMDYVENASIAKLNEEVKQIISTSLSSATVQALLKGHYVDEEYNLTRSGYKALVKVVQEKAK
ncbi:hypothetical protein [Halalkalibacter akibai]|uniref:Uncharacterized protein n=1 Tax=Halalkalibacter akibai (strain ATCC 43226 / DSM 21942 / CIP 109018 / JCM 9157 / 1139) TaxID=1236973 RepID=W4QUF5_HALA3|nr:hypothetical protein [Halalkalibacter akibai]GAE35721.1 hypothetical protein JCM9157_2842 [Halalkalibacter akibai JCM 9157]